MDTLFRDIQRTKLYENPKAVGDAITSLYSSAGLKNVVRLTRNALFWKNEISHITDLLVFSDYAGFPLKEFALKTERLLDRYIRERVSNKSYFEIARDKFCMTICILTAVSECLRRALPWTHFSVNINDVEHSIDCSKIALGTDSIQFTIGFSAGANNKYTDFYNKEIITNIRGALNVCKKMGIGISCGKKRGYYVFTVAPSVVMQKYLEELKQEIYVKEHPEEFEDFDFNDPLKGIL